MPKITNYWRCRIAPSLGGGFDGTPLSAWGTPDYNPQKDLDKPVVFFGLYGLPDFFALWRHGGPRSILWCGSDIQHFKNGYWLESEGTIRLNRQPLAEWIDLYCNSYVENEVEQNALYEMGIKSEVIPSFLGDVSKYKVSYTPSDRPRVYTSVSGDNFKLYGWDKILPLATQHPDIEFHLYGSKNFATNRRNIIVHGRVPIKQMNKETKEMQGALRLTQFDGFSELLAKSILWGQYPISLIKYPHIQGLEGLHTLKFNIEPNINAREYYRKSINKFPWVSK